MINKVKKNLKALSLLRYVFSKNKPVLYLGWVGHGNLGDELLFEAYRKMFPEKKFALLKRSRLMDFIGKYRIPVFKEVALGGGTLIMRKSHLGTLELFSHLPAFCLGTGVLQEEFWKERFPDWDTTKTKWVEQLKRFSFVGVRGPMSSVSLEHMGVSGQVVGDAALVLSPETYIVKKELKRIFFNFGLSKEEMWGTSSDFFENCKETINLLKEDGFEVTLFPIWKDDVLPCKKLAEETNSLLVECWQSTQEWFEQMEKYDLVIATKLHAAVTAAMLRLPFITFEYRPKCRDFALSIEMHKYLLKTSEVESNKVLQMVQTMDTKKIQSHLDEKVKFFKRTLLDSAKEVQI